MADYRNQAIKFFNAGLDLNLPPEGLHEIKWRKLDNIRVLTESVMEARPHTDDFFSSSHFNRKQWTYTVGASTLYAAYPFSFSPGPLVYMAYVGPLKSGEPGFLTIHEFNGEGAWPEEDPSYTTGFNYMCFLNGMPILETAFRKDSLSGTIAPHPLLLTSAEPPSVVRILSPTGPMVVVIDGRWKIIPAFVSLSDGSGTVQYNTALKLAAAADLPVPSSSSLTNYFGLINYVPAYRVGVRKEPYVTGFGGPTAAAGTTTTTGTGGPPSGSYRYRTTYKSKKTGARSPASDASTTVSTTATNGALTVTVYNAVDPQADQIELWREGGNLAGTWRLVTTLTDAGSGKYGSYTTYWTNYAGSTQSVLDTNSDALIALNEALDISLVHPFPATDSSGASVNLLDVQQSGTPVYTGTIPLTCFGPFLGQYVFWIGDPVKRSAFYWNVQGKLDLSTADLSYNVVSDPGEELMNGFVFSGGAFIFSKRKLYVLDYSAGGNPTFTPREIPIGLGLAARNGLAVTRNAVYFVNNSGVYGTDCSGGEAALLSGDLAPLFRGETVDDYLPVDWTRAQSLRLCATSRELHLFYEAALTDGGSIWQHLVYDFAQQRWSRWAGNTPFRYAYELENFGEYRTVFSPDGSYNALYSDDSNKENGAGLPGRSTARTGSWDAGIPLSDKEFGVLMLDYDPDGAEITITPRYNSDLETGTPMSTGTSGDFGGRRTSTFSLEDVFKRALSLEFSWDDTTSAHPKFYQANILFRADEEGIVHWSLPPTALGNQGWFHLKDAYVTLRSRADVTLTIGVDGVETSYTIPNTVGERVKSYVEFRPLRGKLFSIKMESTQPFWFYGEDSELNGKPWKTQTGYKPLNVFQAPGYAGYLRNEGGT